MLFQRLKHQTVYLCNWLAIRTLLHELDRISFDIDILGFDHFVSFLGRSCIEQVHFIVSIIDLGLLGIYIFIIFLSSFAQTQTSPGIAFSDINPADEAIQMPYVKLFARQMVIGHIFKLTFHRGRVLGGSFLLEITKGAVRHLFH